MHADNGNSNNEGSFLTMTKEWVTMLLADKQAKAPCWDHTKAGQMRATCEKEWSWRWGSQLTSSPTSGQESQTGTPGQVAVKRHQQSVSGRVQVFPWGMRFVRYREDSSLARVPGWYARAFQWVDSSYASHLCCSQIASQACQNTAQCPQPAFETEKKQPNHGKVVFDNFGYQARTFETCLFCSLMKKALLGADFCTSIFAYFIKKKHNAKWYKLLIGGITSNYISI